MRRVAYLGFSRLMGAALTSLLRSDAVGDAGPRKPNPVSSAAVNRWTGKPHLHTRAKARGHTHDRLHTNARWEQKHG